MCTFFAYRDHYGLHGGRLLVATVALLLGCALPLLSPASELTAPPNDDNAGRSVLVIGKITHNPKKHVRTMTPFAEHLAAQLADLGISGARVKFAKDIDQMVQYLQSGEVDYVTETTYGAARMMSEAGARPLLLRWKKGKRDYSSIIFTHRDSDIESLQQLRGHSIVFEDRGSTSGYYVPKLALEHEGLTLVELSSPSDPVPADQVGYVFSGAEQNTSALVYAKLADAGAVNNHDWNKPDHMPEEQRKYFRRLHVSEPIPRTIELLHPNVPDELRQRIQDILLAIHNDSSREARFALKKYQATSQFEALTEQELHRLQRLADQLHESSGIAQQSTASRN